MFKGSLIDDLISSVELAEQHVYESARWNVSAFQVPVVPQREFQQFYQRSEVA